MAGWVEGIRRALVLGLVLIAGTAIEQAPSVGPNQRISTTPSPQETDERDIIHQTSQYCRTNDYRKG